MERLEPGAWITIYPAGWGIAVPAEVIDVDGDRYLTRDAFGAWRWLRAGEFEWSPAAKPSPLG